MSQHLRDQRIGVIGAGLMGAEIAMVYVLAGYRVVLVDTSDAALAKARSRLASIYDKAASKGRYDGSRKDAMLDLIDFTTDLASLSGCSFVTEAVFEQYEVKRDVIARLDAICAPDCLIASNTSTIPISVLGSVLPEARRPNFVGTHYFSPVTRMPLIEVVPAIETSQECVRRAFDFCLAVGKTPILIKDVTGFAVNRLLHVMMIEAVRLVEEGVATPQDIDLACKLGLGHPMGPFELMDATTSSLCLQAQEIMFEAYGERFRPRPLLKQRVAAGYVGGRGKKGWRADKEADRG